MTTEETKEVLGALWIIKRECSGNYGHCDECIMFNEGWGKICSLHENDPYYWDLPPMPE